HPLVSESAVVYASSVRLLVARMQQQGQEVVVGRRALHSPPGDDGADDAIESPQRRPRTAVAPRGKGRAQKEEEGRRIQALRERLAEDSEGIANRLRVLLELDSEERPGDDVEAETSHLVVDVDRPLVAFPALHQRTSPLDHERAEGGDATVVEGRLHETPLPQPEVALAGDEPLAEEALQHSVT